MSIAFLLTTSLPSRRGSMEISEDEPLIVRLPDYPNNPVRVIARVHSKDAEGSLTARATGFETDDDAYEAGRQMQSALRAACISIGTAIDVGTKRTVQTALNPEWRHLAEKAALEAGQPTRVVDYVHGVHVFEDDDLSRVMQFKLGAIGVAPASYPDFPDALASEVSRQTAGHTPDEKLETARDLFMAAEIEQSPRSRFLILVTALEVLATRDQRSDELQAHIDSLTCMTSDAMKSSVNRDEMKGLIDALDGPQRKQSIASAIRQLAVSAPGYGDKRRLTKSKITDYYDARSTIVHDGVEPEDFDINEATSWVRNLVRTLVLPEARPPATTEDTSKDGG